MSLLTLLSGPAGSAPVVEDEARSGVAHSGNFRSGNFTSSFHLTAAGVDRAARFLKDGFTITQSLDGSPDTLTSVVRAKGFTLSEGQEIKVFNGGIDVGVPLFAGTLMRPGWNQKKLGSAMRYEIEAVDWTWNFNRYTTITGIFKSMGRNTLVHKLVRQYTDPADGFYVAYAPSSLGDVDQMECTTETPLGLLDRIAKSVENGYYLIDYAKGVHVFSDTNAFEGNTHVISDSDTGWRDLGYDPDLSQVRNPIVFKGGGSETTARVSAGATSIPVLECGWYKAAGGEVISANSRMAYTGRSSVSGPGSLTGVTGILYDIPEGEVIRVLYEASDATAQTALAALLGGGRSGKSIATMEDERLDADGIEDAALAELDYSKSPVVEITYKTDSDLYVRPGKLVSTSLTTPISISGDFRVQEVAVTVRGKVSSSRLHFDRSVTAARTRRKLVDILKQIV